MKTKYSILYAVMLVLLPFSTPIQNIALRPVSVDVRTTSQTKWPYYSTSDRT